MSSSPALPQIYNTHVLVRGLSESVLHTKLKEALQAFPWHSGALFWHSGLERTHRKYVLHVITSDMKYTSFKLHVVSTHTEDAWWLNFVQRGRSAYESFARSTFLGVYSAIMSHAAFDGHVDNDTVHPEYTPRYSVETHMSPAKAASCAHQFQPLPPPADTETVTPAAEMEHVTNYIYPQLFSIHTYTSALIYLARVRTSLSPAAQRAVGLQAVVQASAWAAYDKGEATLLSCFLSWCITGDDRLLHLLEAMSCATCEKCAKERWVVLFPDPDLLPHTRHVGHLRCIVCAREAEE